MQESPLLIAIMGPTGSGKSALAEILAEQLEAQLISADAFQIYRGLDVGTNKPSQPEHYEMIDVRNPNEGFGVGEYAVECSLALSKLHAQKRNVVLVGGTGFYIRALLEKYDDLLSEPSAELRERLNIQTLEQNLLELDAFGLTLELDRNNPIRVQRALERAIEPGKAVEIRYPDFQTHKFAISLETSTIDALIRVRTIELLQSGWIEEVKDLLDKGVQTDSPAFRAIGYSEVVQYLNGELTFDVLSEVIVLQTRRYAKRQRAWLRSEPKLNWLLSDGTPSSVRKMADEVIQKVKK